MEKTCNPDCFWEKPWTFVLVKNGKIIYKSKSQQLKPLIFSVKNYKKEMRGATVFDKMVGRAAAILLVYAKVKEIWTPVVSRSAKRILAKNEIKLVFQKEVKSIMNRKGDDLCPMEKLSRKMKPVELIKLLLQK
ncbi:MAG: hypothetical protein COZ28_01810 [Candidatus Moranbacteria bacterium CG_4_10_14_3_um_filter_44_15]|nr:MAG: hypothetical protein COS72_01840 [Candidatus Moranbacteria bacterium CG06_land_8_20_14_3_00_43_56]PIV83388.1 MAG: hypothetical protein COW51_04625 [Candidatus Moranbacteria bacterium CG17_big_fil_post_rev_8_21_14_2_50_44_12]PIW92914.1 MAG: hypothetical protein COZ87_04050 [Candidatus Moranbacteria bacterium CG_4_8_14_3_um_filter_43_15]PIX90855.1 MAG: hypothetical protein COZ28_01810 [Candidatus Moranbacteria bacterium CG_4_10_14_3_um_filter_44_15]PJA85797.1 MAG: hypothetical protein CO1